MSLKKILKTFALSSVMFAAGACFASLTFLHYERVNAKLAYEVQKIKQNSKTENFIENDDLKFELQGCQRLQKKVNCDFLVTNKLSQNLELFLYANDQYYNSRKARVFDTSGNAYLATTIQLANKKDSGTVIVDIIPGVATKARISFELPQEIRKLSALELRYNINGRGPGEPTNVQFHNIDIGSSQASLPANQQNCNHPQQGSSRKPVSKKSR